MSAPTLPRPRGARTIDDLLAEARARLERVGPLEAAARVAGGALLVDIRPAAQRAREGEVPGALAPTVLPFRSLIFAMPGLTTMPSAP